jgi:hypothetical protein
MGNSSKKGEKVPKTIKAISEKNKIFIQKSNYHCIKCNEIPFIYFFFDSFNIACSTHKINNIPINKFYDHISFGCKCFTCTSYASNDYIYCLECNKIYCIQCKQQLKTCSHKDNIINVKDMNTICRIHHKNYNKFCLNCKKHLCEQCQDHDEHYSELLSDILPTEEEIQKYDEKEKELLNKKNDDDNYNFNNDNDNDNDNHDKKQLK